MNINLKFIISSLIIFSLIELSNLKIIWNQSAPEEEAYIIDGLHNIANFQFQEAHIDFKNLYKVNNKNPAPYFYFAWLLTKMQYYPSPKDYENIFKYLDYAELLADKSIQKNQKDITSLFYKTASNALRSFMEGYRNSWWDSAKSGKEMRKYALKILEIDPNNADALYFLGTYNYFADILPASQKLFRILLFIPGGNKKNGLKQIQIAAENGCYTKIEATQTLLLIYIHFQQNCEEAKPYAISLIKQFPNNPYFKFLLTYCHYKEQKWNLCTDILSDIPIKFNYLKKSGYAALLYEIEYRLARCYMHQDQFEKSIMLLTDLINERPTQPLWLYQWSLLSLAQAYDLSNDEENALLYYNKAISLPDYKNAHSKIKWRLKYNKPLPLYITDY